MLVRERDEGHVDICLPTVTDARLRAYLKRLAKHGRQRGLWVRLTLHQWEKRPGVNGANRTPPVRKPFRRKDLDEDEERLQSRRGRILGIRG